MRFQARNGATITRLCCRLALPWLISIIIVGCKGDQKAPVEAAPQGPFSMTGEWDGSSHPITLFLEVSEDSNHGVTGTGRINNTETGDFTNLQITGSNFFPNVNLTFFHVGFQTAHYSGSFTTENMVAGELNDSGFDRFGMTLERAVRRVPGTIP